MFLPVLFSGQDKECSSRDLRTSGMSMAGATPIWLQLDMAQQEVLAPEFRSSWRDRSWLGSHRLGRQAGCEPEAANGQPQPQPACPPPARPPASSGCSQAFPSRCLAGRAWPCASCSTWSYRANPLTENLACYLTLQREVLPQSGSHNQGCRMRR